MFTRLAPQKAQHNSGFIVQSGSRFTIEYIDNEREAEIEVDSGQVTGVYPDTLKVRNIGGEDVVTSQEEREMILSRILSGMEFLGVEYEICSGRL